MMDPIVVGNSRRVSVFRWGKKSTVIFFFKCMHLCIYVGMSMYMCMLFLDLLNLFESETEYPR